MSGWVGKWLGDGWMGRWMSVWMARVYHYSHSTDEYAEAQGGEWLPRSWPGEGWLLDLMGPDHSLHFLVGCLF